MVQSNRGSDFYRDKSGRDYFESYQGPQAWNGTFLNVPLFRPFIRTTDVILDFACGSGELLSLLHAARKLGVDINPTALEAARKRGIEVVEHVEDVPSGSVDVVISNHGLEHTLRPFDVLSELRRCVRTHGQLVLYLPADSWWRQPSASVVDPNHHLYTWTPLILANLVGEAGWNVKYAKLKFHAWPPRGYALLRHLPTNMAQAICHACGMLLLQPQIHLYAIKT
jgi:SAM-dependent methyltransferase